MLQAGQPNANPTLVLEASIARTESRLQCQKPPTSRLRSPVLQGTFAAAVQRLLMAKDRVRVATTAPHMLLELQKCAGQASSARALLTLCLYIVPRGRQTGQSSSEYLHCCCALSVLAEA